MADQNWKRKEREVAKYFGVERNIHGRGASGSASSDVVVPVPEWYIQDQDLFSMNAALAPISHLFVEVKYSKSMDLRAFNLFDEIKTHAGGKKPIVDGGRKPITIMHWHDYMFFNLNDLPRVLFDLITSSTNMHPMTIAKQYINVRTHYMFPNYLQKFWDQVEKDVFKHRESKGWNPLPFVCLTCSRKSQLVMFNTKFELV